MLDEISTDIIYVPMVLNPSSLWISVESDMQCTCVKLYGIFAANCKIKCMSASTLATSTDGFDLLKFTAVFCAPIVFSSIPFAIDRKE